MSDTNMDNWRIDKQVPIALIATIIIGGLIHTLTFAWAASNLWTRVGVLEQQAIYNMPRLETVGKLEVKVDNVTLQLIEIKSLLNQVQASQAKH